MFYSVDFSPENRAFDLMWISKHHKSVFRFPARLPGLVAMAGYSSLRIPRLSTGYLYNRERGIGEREIGERGTGNGERGTGNGERGTGNGERGTGNGERGTGNL